MAAPIPTTAATATTALPAPPILPVRRNTAYCRRYLYEVLK